MFSTTDTIVAIATPPGRGALGVVRLSGADALRLGAHLIGRRHPLPARVAIFARLAGEGRGMPGDEVVATAFPAPRSSTGEDCFEISAHGSPVVLASILRVAIGAGARLAEPGEFSLRAFLNGKRDLVQLEAVADLVDAVTPLQARAAFDQWFGRPGRVHSYDARILAHIARGRRSSLARPTRTTPCPPASAPSCKKPAR